MRSNSRSYWNIGLGQCSPKGNIVIENNLSNANMPTTDTAGANRWGLGNAPHGAWHWSDSDMTQGGDTHIYKQLVGTFNCRWADFVSYADNRVRSYHCLVISTSYKGAVARPVNNPNYNGPADSYFCNA